MTSSTLTMPVVRIDFAAGGYVGSVCFVAYSLSDPISIGPPLLAGSVFGGSAFAVSFADGACFAASVFSRGVLCTTIGFAGSSFFAGSETAGLLFAAAAVSDGLLLELPAGTTGGVFTGRLSAVF